jgi:hypothetical protein
MKTAYAALAAAAIPLLLSSLPLAAGELPFNAPATAQAQVRAQLLHQAARALGELPATSSLLTRGRYISNLWIFPTADENTVFAQYDLTSSKQGGPSEKHLAVLRIRGNRILEQMELTDARAYSVSGQELPTAAPHWSASIGTGHVFSTESTGQGIPAAVHWSARIGTGTATSTGDATEIRPPSSSSKPTAVVAAHWSSRIGTGHAADSNVRARS